MILKLELRKAGSPVGVVLPKEVMAGLNVRGSRSLWTAEAGCAALRQVESRKS